MKMLGRKERAARYNSLVLLHDLIEKRLSELKQELGLVFPPEGADLEQAHIRKEIDYLLQYFATLTRYRNFAQERSTALRLPIIGDIHNLAEQVMLRYRSTDPLETLEVLYHGIYFPLMIDAGIYLQLRKENPLEPQPQLPLYAYQKS